MSRLLRHLAWPGLALLLTLLGTGFWLLGSTSGARWLLEQAMQGAPVAVQVAELEGSLLGGLHGRQLQVESDDWQLKVAEFETRLIPLFAPLGIRLDTPRLEGVSFKSRGNVEAEQPDFEPLSRQRLAELLAGAVLPLRLEMAAASVTDFRYQAVDGTDLWQIEQLTVSGSWQSVVSDLQLALKAEGCELQMDGRVDLATSRDHDLHLAAQCAAAPWTELLPPDLTLELQLTGPGEELTGQISSASFGWQMELLAAPLADTPQLVLDLKLAQWPTLPLGGAVLRDLQGNLSLTPKGYATTGLTGLIGLLDWIPASPQPAAQLPDAPAAAMEQTLQPGEFPTVSFTLVGSGDFKSVQITQLSASVGELRLDAEGSYSWNDQPQLAANIAWQDLRWPLAPAAETISSKRGQVSLQGHPDAWSLEGDLDLATPDYPSGRFALAGSGNRQGGDFRILQGELLGGTVSATARVDWLPRWAASGQWQARALNIGALRPDLPLELTGQGQFAYQAAAESDAEAGAGALWQVSAEGLQGSYAGQPFNSSGRLSWTGTAPEFEDFRLLSGESQVTLDGSPFTGQPFRAEFDIHASDWLAELAGGPVSGQLDWPQGRPGPDSSTSLLAGPIEYGEFAVAELSLQSGQGGDALTLQAWNLAWGNYQLDTLDLRTSATDGDLLIEAEASAGEWQGNARLRGFELGALAADPQSWQDILSRNWRGQLEQLAISHKAAQLVSLKEPAAMSRKNGRMELAQTCLEVQPAGELCLTASDDSRSANLDLQVRALPLALTQSFWPHELSLTQELEGRVHWTLPHGGDSSAELDLKVLPGTLVNTGNEDLQVETGTGSIRLNLVAGVLSSGQIDLPLVSGGQVRLDLHASPEDDSRLDGRLLLDFPDLSFLDSLSRDYDGIAGALRADLRVAGNWQAPELSGELSLSGGRVSYLALGTRLEDVQAHGWIGNNNLLALDGTFRAGEGSGEFELSLDLARLTAPVLHLWVAGLGVRLVDLPDLSIAANHEVTLDLGGGQGAVGGYVDLVETRLTPSTTFITAEKESPDLVVIAGKRIPAPAGEGGNGLQLNGELLVRLLEPAQLEAELARVNISGGLSLAWQGGAVPNARGALSLDGDATAWGPKLDIKAGRVRWSGGPVNNPELEIRAVRDVFGNTPVRSAGIRISGTARRPEIEAFTNPLTTRERAWTVLLTGSDVDYAQGVGAFDVGTYIAPKVFLSYGISLFDGENVVGLRYDLKRGWGVKVTSGQQDSGADLSYTIDR